MRRRTFIIGHRLLMIFIAPLALLGSASHINAAACESLTQLKLDHVTIAAAEMVAAGGFTIPGGRQNAPPEFFTNFHQLPPFCRVQAVAHPTADSDINIEIWLPVSGWNHRYLGVGNGGYGGSVNYYRLGEALNVGYAVSSTDTGHRGGPRDSDWAVGHREKQIDFDYRAIHEMARISKAVIKAFYGNGPQWSYFNSCSNGGRQGLMSAERYPADYDGIFAGAPALELAFTTQIAGRFNAFAKRGGKIIIYHGGNDAPASSIAFFNKVSSKMVGTRVRRFMQLYIVPGMEHCGSGTEPNEIGQWLRPNADRQHSLFKALEHWVEEGPPPSGVIAIKFVKDGDPSSGIASTRVLCPYRRNAATAQSCAP